MTNKENAGAREKKVLITSRSFGQVSPEPEQLLSEAGFSVEFYNEQFKEEEFIRKLQDCDALIIGAHPLSEEALKRAGKLRIVSKHGAGLDNIDLDLAQRYGLIVTNVPAVNSNAVADLAFSLILDVARRTSFAAESVKNGRWSRVTGVDVHGKTLALIGFGEIGKNVARRAAGFSMKVQVYDPFLKALPDEFQNASLVSFQEALEGADFLSLHIPLNDKTRDLIGRDELFAMKKGSYLINTSRGGIVKEEALAEAIESGHIAGAGLDVLDQEPPEPGNLLLSMDEVTITPHMGMYSLEAINAVSLIAAKNVVDYFRELE